jgi:hypothetical protein
MRFLIRCLALLVLVPICALAAPRLECPPEPAGLAQVPTDVRIAIRESASEIGRVSASDLEASLRARYPQISPQLIEQALHAAYCQQLAAQAQLTHEQRLERFRSLHTAEEGPTTRGAVPEMAASGRPPVAIRSLTAGADVAEAIAAPTTTPNSQPTSATQIPPFPWPPPPPSASRIIPGGILMTRLREHESHSGTVLAVHGRYHLRDVDAVLRRSLRSAGYEFRYYSTPRGFAMVARLERIDKKGAPFPAQERFDTAYRPLEGFSLMSYLRALFLAPPGYYRVIAFIISPEPFRASGKPVSAEEANAWLEGGVNILPRGIGDLEYILPDYACTALIYEFEKRDTQNNPVELHPGRLSADTHLESSGIAKSLWNQLYR